MCLIAQIPDGYDRGKFMPLLAFSAFGNFRPLGFCRRGLGFLHLPDFLFSALGSPIYLLCTVQDKFLGRDGYDPHHAKFLQSVAVMMMRRRRRISMLKLKASSYTLFVG